MFNALLILLLQSYSRHPRFILETQILEIRILKNTKALPDDQYGL